jgi:hypothetical protein
MGGTSGSAMLLIAGQDLRTPWLDRLFIDPFASVGYVGETESYINGNPDFPNQDAGTNGSSKHNFVRGEGFDNFLRRGCVPTRPSDSTTGPRSTTPQSCA